VKTLSARPRLSYRSASLSFLLIALAALPVADIAFTALDPAAEFQRLIAGALQPAFSAVEVWSVIWTVAFAVLGVAAGGVAGLAMALIFDRFLPIRLFSAFLRSVHELFWALFLLQITGLSPATGILAIALPYTGIFAKVFAEIIEGSGSLR